jgi:thioredoxin-like negative regulator of GroEL
MPRSNPESSFEASARHLFRHINDVKALRTNPLLRPFFVLDVPEDRSVLQEIHAHLLMLTDAFCDEMRSKDSQSPAQRRREIVASLCAGESPDETASRLKISRSHYYRERFAIASRVARALRRTTPSHATQFVVRDDPLRLLFKRAESLRDAGRAHEAAGMLEEARRDVADEFAKAAVDLSLAEELVFLGCHDRAKELLAQSRSMPAQVAGHTANEWLRDSWTLNKARLESQLHEDGQAASALETLAKRRVAERRSDDVTFDAVFLAAEQYRNSGRYAEARTMLRHMRAMDQKPAYALAKRQIAIFLLAAYCAEGSTDELGLAEQSLRDALELSVSSGTVVGALLAMSGLIHHETSSGRDDAAYAMAHEAIRMAAGVDFDGFVGYVAAQMVGALLSTRYWRATSPLVFEAEKITAPGTLSRALLKRAQANFFVRAGRRDRARDSMGEALTLAKRLGNRKLEGLILRDRALALTGADAVGERGELMREAVALIERYGSADDLLTTYEAAARVLADRRSLRLARQARTAVLACAEALRESPGQNMLRPRKVEPLRLP